MSLVSLFCVAECMMVTRDRFWTSQMSSLMINLKLVMLTTVRFRSYRSSVTESFLFDASDFTTLDAVESNSPPEVSWLNIFKNAGEASNPVNSKHFNP